MLQGISSFGIELNLSLEYESWIKKNCQVLPSSASTELDKKVKLYKSNIHIFYI